MKHLTIVEHFLKIKHDRNQQRILEMGSAYQRFHWVISWSFRWNGNRLFSFLSICDCENSHSDLNSNTYLLEIYGNALNTIL